MVLDGRVFCEEFHEPTVHRHDLIFLHPLATRLASKFACRFHRAGGEWLESVLSYTVVLIKLENNLQKKGINNYIRPFFPHSILQ